MRFSNCLAALIIVLLAGCICIVCTSEPLFFSKQVQPIFNPPAPPFLSRVGASYGGIAPFDKPDYTSLKNGLLPAEFEDPRRALQLNQLGVLHYANEYYDEAIELFLEAIVLEEKSLDSIVVVEADWQKLNLEIGDHWVLHNFTAVKNPSTYSHKELVAGLNRNLEKALEKKRKDLLDRSLAPLKCWLP